jgi:hypothetical protein
MTAAGETRERLRIPFLPTSSGVCGAPEPEPAVRAEPKPTVTTRYEDLATHATRWVDHFYRHKETCRGLILQVATAFTAYLGCPAGRVSFTGLDAELRFTGRPILLDQQPHLVRGDDGCWYVGLQIMLQVPNARAVMKERMKVGVNHIGSRYVAVLGTARFEIDEGSLNGMQALVEAMVSQSLAHYATPVHAGPLPPGFMVNR